MTTKTKPAVELYFTTLLTDYGPDICFYSHRGIVDISQVPFIFVQMDDNPEKIIKASEIYGSGVIRLYNYDVKTRKMRVDIRALKNRKTFNFNFPYPFFEKLQ